MSLHLDAGKYALYLWPAYGLSGLVIAGLVIESLMRAARWRRAAQALERKDPPPPDSP